ncbi:MAG: hypothetical protein FWC49_00140 [Proteobacteria bacterium]|nr:hypothetical protein [Pseudomonadota bacterium]
MKRAAQLKMGLAICCVLAAAGCAQNSAKAPAGANPDIAVKGIAVLPVKPVSDLDENLSGADGKLLQGGSQVLDGLMKERLAGKAGIHFIPAAQAGKMRGDGYNLATARLVAAQAGCNVVLETTLSRYNERVGGEYGAKQPAAVTFAYKLYEVSEGRVLCHGRFDEQQQSLMENLLDLPKTQSRGLVWLTAEELARAGLKERLAQCPYLEGK